MLESRASSAIRCFARWSGFWNPAMQPGEAILAAMQEFLAVDLFVFEDREVLREAIVRYQEGKADFSDCLIGAKASTNGARTTYTFERVLAREPGFTRLT